MGLEYPNKPEECDHLGRWIQRPRDSQDGKGYIYCPKCGKRWPLHPEKRESKT